jgi:hypothetical protein
MHVEALQLTDISETIDHIKVVLEHASADNLTTVPINLKLQETVVIYYFCCLMKFIEKLNTSAILSKLHECKLLLLISRQVVRMVNTDETVLASPLPITICEGLARLADCEDFQTCWKSYFDPETLDQFYKFEAVIFIPTLAANPERKIQLRALADLFCRLNRQWPSRP